MCLLHKQDAYGEILLKQIDKQDPEPMVNFAKKIARHLPYNLMEINIALDELVQREVICVEDDRLYQKRMVKDANLSDTRAKAGSKGGKSSVSTKQFAKAKSEASALSNFKANTEYENENEYEYENEIKSENKIGGVGEKNQSANYRFRKLVVSRFPDYVLTDEDERYHVDSILSYHRKYLLEQQKRAGNPYPGCNDNSLVESLEVLLDRLPDFWKEQFSLGMLAKQQSRIISQIKTTKKSVQDELREKYSHIE